MTVGLSLLLWAAAWPFLTLGFLNHYDSAEAAWIRGLYQLKDVSLQRPAQGPGGRLIIVGGSGTLFGIDAELIERKLGVTTVNYGTHAGLGGYILGRARAAARPGDTILLSPEYELWYNKATDCSDVQWAFVCTYDKRHVLSQGLASALRTLYSQPGDAYLDALSGWQYRVSHFHEDINIAQNMFMLDTCGDPRIMPPRRAFPQRGSPMFPDPANPACAVQDYRDFARWARRDRVRVLYSWPNICEQAWPRGAPSGAVVAPAQARAFLDELGFIALNEPSDTIFPRDWFDDTFYHLDGGCRRVRTEALIRRLRPYFTLPSVPATGSTGAPQASALDVQGIYLVGGGTSWLRPGNTFADRPGVQVKYLVPHPMECPDAITPSDVAALAARGVPIWVDDPAVRALLPAEQWDSTQTDTVRETIAGWLARYDHHLFLVAHAGAATTALPPALPADARTALEGPAPAVAAFGTGNFSRARRVRTGAASAMINVRSDFLLRENVPRVWLLARASAQGPDGTTAQSRIEMNSVSLADAPDGSIAVAVIDPKLGTVVDSGIFGGNATETVWSIWQLSLRPQGAESRNWKHDALQNPHERR